MYIDKQTEVALRSIARVTPNIKPVAKKAVSRRPAPLTPEQLLKRYGAPLNDWQTDFGTGVVHSK